MSSTVPVEPSDVAVLMELRHRTLPPTEAIARLIGAVDMDALTEQLDRLSDAGFVAFRSGDQFAGWLLTADGLVHLDTAARAEARSSDVAAALGSVRRQVESDHERMLDVAVEWRVRLDLAGVERLNDHTDADYDGALIVRLRSIHQVLEPKLDRLSLCLPRYGQYRCRLAAALDALADGRHDHLTSPIPTSYLSTWFDLRGDLAVTLGDSIPNPHGST